MHFLLFYLNRLLGRETVLSLNLLGVPLRLGIQARREIKRAHAIARETALVERMWDHLQDGDTVYDIGANIGVISLLLALCPRCSVAAVRSFEPEPRNFHELERNISINDMDGRVLPHRLALGAEEGEVRLFVRGTAGEGRHSIATDKGATDSISVPLSTYAAFVAKEGAAADMVKIDVEGAEGQVLAGMDALPGEQRPREIFMEVHPKGGRDLMPNGETIQDWLVARGYELAWSNELRSGQHRHYTKR